MAREVAVADRKQGEGKARFMERSLFKMTRDIVDG